MTAGRHIVFMDGVTGYLGRWTLFWFLTELPDERVAVLIRPQEKGEKAQADAQRRLLKVLDSIGLASQRERVTVIPGELSSPYLGNPEAMGSLQADCWLHMAGDVTFKKLGDKTSLVTNLDYTVNFIETAAATQHIPRTVCHTSTFYVFEKAGDPDGEYTVPEAFHDLAEMDHHNAYGYSKLKAETYLQSLVESGSLPFNLLIFRPDIIMHHIPVKEVSAYNPGLITDDFKVVYQLMAAMLGRTKIKLPNGPTINSPLKYIPVNENTVLNISDADSVTKAMMQLAVLFGDGGMTPDLGYQIFHLVNRWRPIPIRFIRELCEATEPDKAKLVTQVTPDQFKKDILPKLSMMDKIYYTNLIEPFVGYMNRARTHALTDHVDALLGENWHHLHPDHGVDLADWLERGARQALDKDFGAI
ncbi:MAG: SDR family oxidoreductase [Cyanobacteriota bacterium]|nr:SDR family oxidoreductase [Cyanobacteriota bacterium]